MSMRVCTGGAGVGEVVGVGHERQGDLARGVE